MNRAPTIATAVADCLEEKTGKIERGTWLRNQNII
jgi:hypothetical protein